MSDLDQMMDNIHHALGRPQGPHDPRHRNYFFTAVESPHGRSFDASPFWRRYSTVSDGKDAYYEVTDEGRAALWPWLRTQQLGRGLRPWRVEAEGIAVRSVLAKSRAAARYAVYLDISAVCHDLTFNDFLAMKLRVLTA